MMCVGIPGAGTVKAPFTGEDPASVVLTLLGRKVSPYWTLNGGGAVVFHYRHRGLAELDFHVETESWTPEVPHLTVSALVPLIPSGRVDEFVARFPSAPRFCTHKIHFSKIVLSFVMQPPTRGIRERVYAPSFLPIAGLMDAVGGKFQALYERIPAKFNDYFDAATALERGFQPHQIISALESMRYIEIDYVQLFWKMSHPPEEIAQQLTQRHCQVLRNASEAGLRLLPVS